MRLPAKWIKRGVVGVVVASLLLVAAWRMGLLGAPSSAANVYIAAQAGTEAYGTMAMVQVATLKETDKILEQIDRAEWQVDEGIPKDIVNSLRSEVATFIRLRFVERDAEKYREWRISRGCRFAPISEIERKTSILTDYQVVFGRPAPSNPQVEILYQEYWAQEVHQFDGASDLRGMTSDRLGLVVRVGRSNDRQYPRLLLGGALGDERWYGATSASMRRWFNPEREPVEIVEKRRDVLCAEVGIVSEWGDGRRRPLLLAWFYDPTRSEWILWLMNQNNFDPRKVVVAPLSY